ncbi:PREDICTED: mannan endo-1,4-beta-mannosidase 5-like isoform X2 [Populus euphratica]|uniref:mannan endo-1,4-beta-mannosidase n=1 Tax=Populus euphratica TaxID=75702 RepID=A0AAJ6SXW8_POPEU|nr:PREDICTED: mannan endo-1,4-beta-mannosidase 5-like isoform X2 [Populus euphratica]
MGFSMTYKGTILKQFWELFVFNEGICLQGLDYVIVEARSNRIRLILSLVNNLVAFGGKTQYVKWAKEAGVNVSSSDDSFFSNPVIKDYFKAYIKAVVKRKNSLSGVRYSEELAIFRLGAHVSDGDIAPRKPVLFTEVGSSRHVDEKGVFDRDVLSKTVYDKIYESVKKRRAGAFIWQLLAEGVDGYTDK